MQGNVVSSSTTLPNNLELVGSSEALPDIHLVLGKQGVVSVFRELIDGEKVLVERFRGECFTDDNFLCREGAFYVGDKNGI